MNSQVNHWLFRVGDGSHLYSSSKFNTWGISSKNSGSKYFLNIAKRGDKIWFVKSKSGGLLIGVATFTQSNERIDGVTKSDEELGWIHKLDWVKTDGWDTEILFEDFKLISDLNLKSQIKASANPRIYNERCLVNLPIIYSEIFQEQKVLWTGVAEEDRVDIINEIESASKILLNLVF